MLALKRLKLRHAYRVLVDDARKIHEFGKPDDLRVIAERQKFLDRQVGARCFQMGRGYAGGQLHADVHDGFHGAVEEELQSFHPQNIGDFVRVADGCRDAIRQNAAVELMGVTSDDSM